MPQIDEDKTRSAAARSGEPPRDAKRPWVTPHCEELPLLTGFLLQQGSGIPGGGGGGGTVFGI
jgi:hypothetical protein